MNKKVQGEAIFSLNFFEITLLVLFRFNFEKRFPPPRPFPPIKTLPFLLAATLGLACLTSCQQKTEEQIKKELEAEYQHKMDSMKLAEAEAKIEQMEQQNAAKAAAKPAKSTESSAPVASASTFSPEFSWLSERHVTEADLAGLSSWEKCIYRNAIYAMHGRKFVKAKFRNYFSQFAWYTPLYDEVKLTRLEQQNVEFIKARE